MSWNVDQIRTEDVWEFRLEAKRLVRGLKTKHLRELVDKVLEYTEDVDLCAILADLAFSSEKRFLDILLEYFDELYLDEQKTRKLCQQVDIEKILYLCETYIPRLEELLASVKDKIESKINYTRITKDIYNEFIAIYKTLEAESDSYALINDTPWYVDEFSSLVLDMSFTDHLANEVERGVHEWNPVWEDKIPKWIEWLKSISENIG